MRIERFLHFKLAVVSDGNTTISQLSLCVCYCYDSYSCRLYHLFFFLLTVDQFAQFIFLPENLGGWYFGLKNTSCFSLILQLVFDDAV
jgi:hypothetical protein